jgi:hypothetical protein
VVEVRDRQSLCVLGAGRPPGLVPLARSRARRDVASEPGSATGWRGKRLMLRARVRLSTLRHRPGMRVRWHDGAPIWCYSFGGIVGGAASNSAFSLALSCSTAARTRAIP